MEVLIVRHAIAEERRAGLPDAERQLTRKGRSRFERGVRGLAALGMELDRVHHSPWTRAAQTAEMMQPLLRPGCPLLVCDGLTTDPTDALVAELARGRGPTRIAAVGHEPWMGELLSLLVLGSIELGGQFPFKKGGVAWLAGAITPGGMELKALWTPKSLRMLGDGP